MVRAFSSALCLALLLLLTGHAAAGAPSAFVLPHDTIPNFAFIPSIRSMADGPWSSPATWLPPRVPLATDVVLIQHRVTYDTLTGTADTIGVEADGVLTFSRGLSTRLTVATLQVLPQGLLDVGSPGNPIPASVTAEIVMTGKAPYTVNDNKDIYDPYQFGTGLLVIDGTVTLQGTIKVPTFLRVSIEPHAGDTTLVLSSVPSGWQVGDQVLLPDTRQLSATDLAKNNALGTLNMTRLVSQSEVVTIAAVTGITTTETTLTLAQPLAYSHLGARTPDGRLDYLPHVGNLTRNVVVRSASPQGVRGHTMYTQASSVSINNAAFVSLGRTTGEPLDVTTKDAAGVITHVGTNQLGRYPLHAHHLYGTCPAGPSQFQLVGNVVRDARKWALTVHGSHYGLIKDNVVYDALGAGIVTEDGSETGNVFEHNFVVHVENPTLLPQNEMITDPRGRKGSGFWFRGSNNAVRGNVAADTRDGIGFWDGAPEAGPDSRLITVNVPNYPCAQTMVAGQYTPQKLMSLGNKENADNEAYSASQSGMLWWFAARIQTGSPAILRSVVWHVPKEPVAFKYMDAVFDGLIIRNDGGVGIGIADKNQDGQADGVFELHHADMQGVDVLYQRQGQLLQRPYILVYDSLLRSKSGWQFHSTGQGGWRPLAVFRNTTFQSLPGMPLKSLVPTWMPKGDLSDNQRAMLVYNAQGVAGDDYRVWYPQQAPGLPMVFKEKAPCNDTTTHPAVAGITCPISYSAPDTIHPSRPAIFTATLEGQSVKLLWTPSEDDHGVVNYLVARCLLTATGCGTPTALATLDGAVLTYQDGSVAAGKRYVYTVTAVDAAGNKSTSATVTLVLP